MLAFLIKASVAALKKFPEFNASLDGEQIVLKQYFHIGFAADTPNGLVVPVIKDADKKGVIQISQEMSELAKKARDGKLTPGDMSGGCFSISSLGGIGGRYFTPIINAPEVAILGVCRSTTEPVWDGKAFQPRLILPLSLSWDHRVVDGAAAARFNAFLIQVLGDFRRVLPVTVDVRVPDIGDFSDVAVIEVLVKPGDTVAVEQSLITIESDKASMEIPSSHAGVVKELKVAVGDKVNEGTLILRLEGEAAATATPAAKPAAPGRRGRPAAAPAAAPARSTPPAAPAPVTGASARRRAANIGGDTVCDLLVLGAGPGGYSAAFRAADLGLKVVLVERYKTLGGVCLNVGCIPSKAMLHVAAVIDEVAHFGAVGVEFGAPKVDAAKLVAHKNKVVGRLTGGLAQMAKMRKVTVVHRQRPLQRREPRRRRPRRGRHDDDRLHPRDHRRRLGGSEAAVHAQGRSARRHLDRRARAAGAAEADADRRRRHHRPRDGNGLLDARRAPRRRRDARRPDARRRPRPGEGLAEAQRAALRQHPAQDQDGQRRGAQGRHPGEVRRRGRAQGAGLRPRPAGGRPRSERQAHRRRGRRRERQRARLRSVDIQMRTNVPHIFAVGDIVGQPMLEHKAVHEAHVAAEVVAGEQLGDDKLARTAFDARVIPSVAYTDPEIAWVGITEDEAKARGVKVKKGLFPWTASGRAIANGRDEGFTKLLFDEASHRDRRRRHRRHARRRHDRRGRAGDRDGRRRRRHRQDDPSASDARRIDRSRCGGVRGRLHRPAAGQALTPTCRRRRRAALAAIRQPMA